ncbi:phage tail protein [Glycomyces paridis]|uniref:Phage tail protein n=1 Tax=Glycomyces paridis TaxID=2126555 RepID=A0A4S8P8L5_9ACTN|nr:hypothetical protein [Glycomyces paridis]THV26011.1 hypothetical protein E9998_19970 [Glycomyces paridis]
MSLNLGELHAIIDADDRGFHRTIGRVNDSLGDTSKRMQVIAKMSMFATMATGAAGAASAIGPLLGLVSTLATATAGLGVAIPAFAGGGAAAIGTLTLAFQGLGDAIAGDEDALEELTGPAREFVGVVEDLKPAWEGVLDAVQATFFEHLATIFDRVAGNVLPHLESGLVHVADGLSEVAAAALDAADLPEVLKGLDAVMEGTGDGLSAMAEGVSGWARGLGILMGEGAPLLERAGIAAANLGEKFGDWVAQAAETGKLQDLIESMLDTFQTLGSIVANVGSILGSVLSAANETGGGLLGTIETLTGRLAEFLASTEGQEGLSTFFAALAAVADAVIPIVLSLAETFGTVLAPKIAEIAENIGPSLAVVADNIGEALSRIDVGTVASALGEFLEVASLILIPLAELLGFLLELSPVLLPIAGIVLAIVGALKAYQAVILIATIAQWAWNAALYANPIVWIIAAVIALIAIIVLLVVYWDEVVAALKVAWDWLIAQFVNGKDMIVTAIEWIVDTFVGMRDQAVAAITDFLTKFNDWVDGVLDAIQGMGGIPGKIAGWIQDAKDNAIDRFQSMIEWIKDVPGKVMDALGDLGSLLKNAGKDIIQGLLDGIQDKFGEVQDMLGELTSKLPDWKGPEQVDRKILGPAGEMVIGGFVDGLERAIPSVQRALSGLTSDIGLQVDGAAAPSPTGPTFVVDVGDINLNQAVQVELDGQVLDARIVGTVNRQARQQRRAVMAGTGGNL